MKIFISKVLIIAAVILPAFSYAEGSNVDMEAYSVFAGYGFFFLLALSFGFFLYYATHPKVYVPKKPEIIQQSASVVNTHFLSVLNGIYYAVIALMVLYAVVFIIHLL